MHVDILRKMKMKRELKEFRQSREISVLYFVIRNLRNKQSTIPELVDIAKNSGFKEQEVRKRIQSMLENKIIELNSKMNLNLNKVFV